MGDFLTFSRERLGEFRFSDAYRSNLDWDAWLRLAQRGKVFVRAPEALVGRRHNALTETSRGEGGFGYDPVFVPEGEEHTFAELGDEWKDRTSHRAHAVRALLAALGAVLLFAGCGDRDQTGRRVLDA